MNNTYKIHRMTPTSRAWTTVQATVPGRDHVLRGRNSQDAQRFLQHGDTWIGVVSDGCSAGTSSEVGSQLATNLLPTALLRRLSRDQEWTPSILEDALSDLLGRLDLLLTGLAHSPSERRTAIRDHFLFTLLGAIHHRGKIQIFGLGDGILGVNGVELPFSDVDGHSPAYLGYALLPEVDLGHLPLYLHPVLDAREVEHVLLASDGAGDLARMGPEVPSIGEIASQEIYLTNPDMARRKLAQIQRRRRGPWLPDDTTLLVIRRKSGARA